MFHQCTQFKVANSTSVTEGQAGRMWLEERDVPAVVAACQDPEIPRWTRVPFPYTDDDARAYLAIARADAAVGCRQLAFCGLQLVERTTDEHHLRAAFDGGPVVFEWSIAAGAGALAGVAYTLLTGSEVPTVRACIASVLVLAAILLIVAKTGNEARYRVRADRDARVILGTSFGGFFAAYLGAASAARPAGVMMNGSGKFSR